MKTLSSSLVIIGLIILTITNPLIARFDYWDSENGVKIRQGYHVFWTGTAMITDGNDHWLIAWADARSGTMDVYAQLYDADGNELWTPGGMVIADGPWPEEMPMLVYAGNDEWIIGWHDYRLDLDYYGRMVVYAQKYNSQGEALWTDGGVFIGPEGGNSVESKFQKPTAMHATADGGAICTYENGDGEFGSRLYAQRLSSDGEMLWNHRGVTLTEETTRYISSSDGDNGMFYLLHKIGQVGEHNLTIHHINSDGEPSWGEYLDGLTLDNTNGMSHHPRIALDGDGGLFVCWVHNNPQHSSSIYGQHITNEGEFNWDEYGSELTSRREEEIYFEMVNSSPLEIGIIWWGFNSPIFAQRIESVDDRPVLHWGEEDEELAGLLVSETEENSYLKSINTDGRGGLVATWVDQNVNKYRDFKVQRITVDGEMPWDEMGTIRVREIACSSQKIIALHDRLFFAWRESSPPVSGISFQAYDIDDGSTQFEEYGIPVVSGISSTTQHPKIIRSGESAYVSWVDARYSPFGKMPYMQRVDLETGQPQWEYQGINLTPAYLEDNDSSNTAIYQSVKLIPDGSGGAISLWAKRRVVAQRVSEDGSLEWGEGGIFVFGQDVYNFNASCSRELFSDNDGGAVVIAELERYGNFGNQIRIQRLDPNGQTLLGEDGIVVQENEEDHYNLHMKSIKLADGNFLVLWLRDENLEAIKVNVDGEYLWESPVVLKEFEERYSNYKVVEIENTIVVTYNERHEEAYRTFMIYIDQNGERLHNQNDLRLDNFDDDNELVEFHSEGNKGWITFKSGSELYISCLGTEDEGSRLDDEKTQLVAVCENNSIYTNIVGDGVGGVFVFWQARSNTVYR